MKNVRERTRNRIVETVETENFECMHEEGSDNDGGDDSIPPPRPTKDKTPLNIFEELLLLKIS